MTHIGSNIEGLIEEHTLPLTTFSNEVTVSSSSITPIQNPDAQYLADTTKIDISSIPNFTTLSSITDGIQTVTFSTDVNKRKVPDGGWATWSSPPFSEDPIPHVLYSEGETSLTLTLSKPSTIFGFELEPNPFQEFEFTVEFYSGSNLVGSITRTVEGAAGARLFAAETNGPAFDRVVIIGQVDFAIAQVRYKLFEGCPIANPQTCCQEVVEFKTQLVPPALDLGDNTIRDVHVEIVGPVVEDVCPEKVIICGKLVKTFTYTAVMRDGTQEENTLTDEQPFQCVIDRDDANEGDTFKIVGAAVLCQGSPFVQNRGTRPAIVSGGTVDVWWKVREKDIIKVCIRKEE